MSIIHLSEKEHVSLTNVTWVAGTVTGSALGATATANVTAETIAVIGVVIGAVTEKGMTGRKERHDSQMQEFLLDHHFTHLLFLGVDLVSRL